MQEFVKSLSDRTEFVFVLVVAFGYFIYLSLLSATYPAPYQQTTTADLYALLVLELKILIVILPVLYVRGWTLQRVGLMPNVKETYVGVALAVATYVAYFPLLSVALFLFPGLDSSIAENELGSQKLSLLAVIAVCIINSFFEELFLCGYIMTSVMKKRNVWVAINASVFLRLLYHLYQGPLGAINIILTGVVFSYWFARTGRLWPLIVAHGLLNFYILLDYTDF